jgi:hypothetical protein
MNKLFVAATLATSLVGVSQAHAGFASSFERAFDAAGGSSNETPLLLGMMQQPPAPPPAQQCITHRRRNGDIEQTCRQVP